MNETALPPAGENRLSHAFQTHVLPINGSAREDCLATLGPSITGLVTASRQGADAALMERLPRLQIIAVFGMGLDAVDLDLARARNMAVTHTPDLSSGCVADAAFALLLATARQLVHADRFIRQGQWPQRQFGAAQRVWGKRLGILGFGRIGQAIARRAAGFDMPVAYHARHRLDPCPYRYFPTAEALADWSDFLIVTVSGGAQSRHLVNRQVLAALGNAGILINVARGSVIDEDALIDALSQGTIAGAGLDVFAHEPRVPAALQALDNAVLMPHIGSNTHETRADMAALVLENLQCHFSGRPLPTPAPERD